MSVVPKRFLRHTKRSESLLTLRFTRKITRKYNRLNVTWCKKADFQRQLPLTCIPNLSCFTCDDIDWIRPEVRWSACAEQVEKLVYVWMMSERERNFISCGLCKNWYHLHYEWYRWLWFSWIPFRRFSTECNVNELLTLGFDRSVSVVARRQINLRAC